MNLAPLIRTAQALMAPGKGLLAMDESTPTCNHRFEEEGIPQTVAMRQAFVTRSLTHSGDSVAFASGQIIRCSAARWLRLPPMTPKCFRVDTCSVGILSFEHNRGEPVVSLWNDVGHLDSCRLGPGSSP